MNPHQLELFYHVAKSKGVTRAVRQMPYGIQQPSISAQVNALERDLGVTLYERRPFKLTPAGEELFKFVEPFFGRLTEVREKLQGAAQLRIGASPIVFRDYMSPVIESVRKQFPRLNMILRAMNQPELIAGIEQDQLDVVISLLPESLSPSLACEVLLELPLVLLAPKAASVRSADELWRHSKVPETLISLGPTELVCQRFQETLARLGVSWLPSIEMDSLELIETYVDAGYGLGLSVGRPQSKTSASKIRVIDLPGFPSLQLGLMHRKSLNSNDDVKRAFLEEVRKQAARLSPAFGIGASKAFNSSPQNKTGAARAQ
jgi:DNA-binding transcriptional LysR family regulator